MRVLGLMVLAAAACCAQSEEETPGRVSVSFETTFVSSYIWRGWVVNDSPSMQPAVNFDCRGLSASVWSNFSKAVPNNQAWTEMDLSVEYAKSFRPAELSAGFAEYRYPDQSGRDRRSDEISLGIAFDTVLSPSLKYYHDFRLGDGDYWFAGVEREFALPRRMVATVAGGIGLNHHMYQTQTTISDVDLSISLDIPAGKAIITPLFTCMRGHRTLFGTHAAFGLRLTTGNYSILNSRIPGARSSGWIIEAGGGE